MVLDELGKSLKDKAAELAQMLREAVPAREQRAASVEAAQSEHAEAAAFQDKVAGELAVAEGSRKEASETVAWAKSALDAHEPDYRKAVEVLDSKRAELDNFSTYNVVCLDTLRGGAEKLAVVPGEASAPTADGGA